MKNMVKFFGVK